MKERMMLPGLMVVVVVLSAVGCSTATPATPTTQPTEEATAEPTAGVMTNETMTGEPTGEGMDMMGDVPAEVLFIDGMIPHHQQAIDMAEQALEEAEHEELRELAQQIIDAQQAEIEQMEQWRDEWFKDVDPSMGMSIENMPSMEEMMLSTDESVPFDLRFIDAMIVHHEGAILMAQGLLEAAAEHDDLRELAQNMIDSQQEEIDQLKQWREEWYTDAL